MMAATFKLNVGFNGIGWPVNGPAWTNEQFLDDLEAKGFGGEPMIINRWFGGRWVPHDHNSEANIWVMQANEGYQLKVQKAGTYEVPGTGITDPCPPLQHWDEAQQKCVDDTLPLPAFDLTFLTDWIKANPVVAGIGIAGALVILSGGIRIGGRR